MEDVVRSKKPFLVDGERTVDVVRRAAEHWRWIHGPGLKEGA